MKIKPNDRAAWNNRGIALRNLQRFEDAIASFDKSLEFLPDDAGAFYWKACCYALKGQVEEAIANLQRAIELDENYREMAKTDSDFDAIREEARFQALISGNNQG